VTHPDFASGKMLVLAAESAEDQALWMGALAECARVTMENALLGDSMIEKLRAEGTAAETEKSAAMKLLQDEALRIRKEGEDKLRLVENSEQVFAAAKEAEVSGGNGRKPTMTLLE
jgi:hypothetical protein